MKIELIEIRKEASRIGLCLDFDIVSKMPLIGVHHIHDWDHGYESGTGYSGKRREFYADMSEMVSFLYKYIAKNLIGEFIVAPFHRINQFSVFDDENDIYREIKHFLKNFGIRGKSQAGVKLSAEKGDVIEMILEGGFRGVSELCIFFPETKVLIAPNHHFDLPFFTHDLNKEKETLLLLLKDFPRLKYYEKKL